MKKLYKSTGKYNDQQHHNAILEAEITSNPEGFTDTSPMSTGPSVTVKNLAQGNNSVNLLNYWM